jgi:phosphohistidine phosphatase
LLRARQTADIVAAEFQVKAVATVPELAPGQPPAALASWLTGQTRRALVAIVGHEPSLSLAVSWLLAGTDRPFVELKKGAACLLELSSDAGPGGATLVWALRPGALRRIGGKR